MKYFNICFTLAAALTAITFISTAQPGDLDPNFHGDGLLTVDLGFDDFATSVAIQNDQKIVFCGFSGFGSTVDMALVRLNPDGSYDNTFGTNGVVITDVNLSTDLNNELVIQPDGKIVTAGFNNASSQINFVVCRYNTDGTLDQTFGNGGISITAGPESNAVAYGASLQTDGKILVTGLSNNGTNNDVVVARFNTNGSLDYTFSYDGFAVYDVTGMNDVAYAVRQLSDGGILVAGKTENPVTNDAEMLVVKFNSVGVLDNTFSAGGVFQHNFGMLDDEVTDIQVYPDGKILLGGEAMTGIGPAMALVKLNANGTIDPLFGINGGALYNMVLSETEMSSFIITPDNKIVAAGSLGAAPNSDFAVARFNVDGTPDVSFGTQGMVTTDFNTEYDRAYQIQMQADGLFVVAGATVESGGFDCGLARYISGINLGIGEVGAYLGSSLIYPNPITNRTVTVEYELSSSTDVSVQLFSIDGKLMADLMGQETRPVGAHTERLNLPSVPSGAYLLNLNTLKGTVSIRVVVQ